MGSHCLVPSLRQQMSWDNLRTEIAEEFVERDVWEETAGGIWLQIKSRNRRNVKAFRMRKAAERAVARKLVGPVTGWCAYCGKQFVAHLLGGSRRRFCGDNCGKYYHAHNKVLANKAALSRVCVACGKDIPVTAKLGAKCCSRRCTDRLGNIRYRERKRAERAQV